MKTILITGGCGFIGSHFVELIRKTDDYDKIIIVDKLTYAAINVNVAIGDDVIFEKVDIVDNEALEKVFLKHNDINAIVNFAAESHVDNSIASSHDFIQTNIVGTTNLLRCANDFRMGEDFKFIQVSTDEVYGSLEISDSKEDKFTEDNNLAPNSPYSASKASADMIARAYHKTHGLPVCITRCSNNYGLGQHMEKLIPKVIQCAIEDKPIPVYGTGENIRDWIHVDDHCSGILDVLRNGKPGEVYNFGGNCEKSNIELVKTILDILEKPYDLIEYVTDRKGHDFRYAVDFQKSAWELGWYPLRKFDEVFKETVLAYKEQIIEDIKEWNILFRKIQESKEN